MTENLIWTGSLNEPYRLGGHVGLYDTTLRDGEQTVGVVLDPEQKLEIARLLDDLGVDRIEAGFPRVSDDDWQAVKLISEAGLRAEVWGFSRAVHAAFCGVDSTRADLDFFRRAYETAVEAGAREVAVVDTLGIASPEAVGDLVGRTIQWLDGTPVHFHGHNDFGVATASAAAAVRAGATWIHGTINGMGERAGNASLGEIALSLRALYGVEMNLRLDRIRAVAERVRELSCYELEPWKPVTGDTLYRRESGAVASQFHDPPSIEPYSSELVATERSIVLGKKSGIDSVRIKADELGIDLPDERRAAVLAAVKNLGMQKHGLVTDDEFRQLVDER